MAYKAAISNNITVKFTFIVFLEKRLFIQSNIVVTCVYFFVFCIWFLITFAILCWIYTNATVFIIFRDIFCYFLPNEQICNNKYIYNIQTDLLVLKEDQICFLRPLNSFMMGVLILLYKIHSTEEEKTSPYGRHDIFF